MIARVIEIEDLKSAREELLAIGSDRKGVDLMAPKAVTRIVKLTGIKPIAANIIKQEMLALGGEAATPYGALDQSVKQADVLVMGTQKQFALLVKKLKLHQFGLPKTAEEIDQCLRRYVAIPKSIKIGKTTFDFKRRTYIMGVLNVTPDSFSDGGKFAEVDTAVERAQQMLEEGADIIDVGGESTRPGSRPVPTHEELRRVLPVIKRLARNKRAVISIDTTKAAVAREAIAAGAAMVNDISGLRFDKKMASVVAKTKIPLCLMHIQGNPRIMQKNPVYADLMTEVIDYLAGGLAIAKDAGILLDKIIIDPGIGFGKTVEHNLEILRRLKELKALGCPIMVGPSRKSVIGKVLGLPVEDRLEGTAALVAAAIMNGANLVRVHDVKAMARVAGMVDAIVRRK